MAQQSPWNVAASARGASQPASTLAHGVVQPVADQRLDCGQFSLVSFNFGLEQTMMESKKAWTQTARKFASLLLKLSSGMLQRNANDAIVAFGHGTMREETGRDMHLGGSIGGVTRLMLDEFQAPDETVIERFN